MLAQANAQLRQTSLVRAIQLAVVVIFFGAWALVTGAHAINPLFLPAPLAVAGALAHLSTTRAFWGAVGVTSLSTAIAYAIAVSAGIVLGFFIGRSPTLTAAYRPVLAGMFAIPITLFFPLFVVMFGLGPPSKIAFGALYGFFPVVLSGLRIGFFITFASVLGGETLSSASGVGHAIAHEADLLDSPPMFAWIVIVLAVTVGLNLVLSLIEKRAVRS